MNPETENDHLPRRAEGPSVKKISAWLAALLILLGLYFFAMRWKAGSERANCVMNIRNFQTGARSFAGVRPEEAGPRDPVDANAVYKFMGPSHPRNLIPYKCPSGGGYTACGRYGDPPGTVLLSCSHPGHELEPGTTAHW